MSLLVTIYEQKTLARDFEADANSSLVGHYVRDACGKDIVMNSTYLLNMFLFDEDTKRNGTKRDGVNHNELFIIMICILVLIQSIVSCTLNCWLSKVI